MQKVDLTLTLSDQKYSSIIELVQDLYQDRPSILRKIKNREHALNSYDRRAFSFVPETRLAYIELRLDRIIRVQLDVDYLVFESLAKIIETPVVVFYENYSVMVHGSSWEGAPIFVYHSDIELGHHGYYSNFVLDQNINGQELMKTIERSTQLGYTSIYDVANKMFYTGDKTALKKYHQLLIRDYLNNFSGSAENNKIGAVAYFETVVQRKYQVKALAQQSIHTPRLLAAIQNQIARMQEKLVLPEQLIWLAEASLRGDQHFTSRRAIENKLNSFFTYWQIIAKKLENLKTSLEQEPNNSRIKVFIGNIERQLDRVVQTEYCLDEASRKLKSLAGNYTHEECRHATNFVRGFAANPVSNSENNNYSDFSDNDSDKVFRYIERDFLSTSSFPLATAIQKEINAIRSTGIISYTAAITNFEDQLRKFLELRNLLLVQRASLSGDSLLNLVNQEKAIYGLDDLARGIDELVLLTAELATELDWPEAWLLTQRQAAAGRIDQAIESENMIRLGDLAPSAKFDAGASGNLYTVLEEYFKARVDLKAQVKILADKDFAAHQQQREPMARLEAVERGEYDQDYAQQCLLSTTLAKPLVIFYKHYPPVILGKEFLGEAMVLFHDIDNAYIQEYTALNITQAGKTNDINFIIAMQEQALKHGNVVTYTGNDNGFCLMSQAELTDQHAELRQSQITEYNQAGIVKALLSGEAGEYVYLSTQKFAQEPDSILKTFVLAQIDQVNLNLQEAYKPEYYDGKTHAYLVEHTNHRFLQWTELNLQLRSFWLAKETVLQQLVELEKKVVNKKDGFEQCGELKDRVNKAIEKAHSCNNLPNATQEFKAIQLLFKSVLGDIKPFEDRAESLLDYSLQLAQTVRRDSVATQEPDANPSSNAAGTRRRKSSITEYIGSMVNGWGGNNSGQNTSSPSKKPVFKF